MRSTKDLKDIVTDIRGKSKGRFTEGAKMPSTQGMSMYQNKENADDDGPFIAKA